MNITTNMPNSLETAAIFAVTAITSWQFWVIMIGAGVATIIICKLFNVKFGECK